MAIKNLKGLYSDSDIKIENSDLVASRKHRHMPPNDFLVLPQGGRVKEEEITSCHTFCDPMDKQEYYIHT